MVNMNAVVFTGKTTESPSKTSVFIKFLIKICVLPIEIEETGQKISFRFLSKSGLIYLVIYLGLGILMSSFHTYFMDDDLTTQLSQMNSVETYTMFATGILNVSLMFPLLLAKGLNDVNVEMIWDERLPFPKHGVKTIMSFFGSIAGISACSLGVLLQFDITLQSLLKIFIYLVSGNSHLFLETFDNDKFE